jgi:hypothetical protein
MPRQNVSFPGNSVGPREEKSFGGGCPPRSIQARGEGDLGSPSLLDYDGGGFE